jgi:hypothetical protein
LSSLRSTFSVQFPRCGSFVSLICFFRKLAAASHDGYMTRRRWPCRIEVGASQVPGEF